MKESKTAFKCTVEEGEKKGSERRRGLMELGRPEKGIAVAFK